MLGIDTMLVLAIGSWTMGFIIGYGTGSSQTPGTLLKVLGVIAGLEHDDMRLNQPHI